MVGDGDVDGIHAAFLQLVEYFGRPVRVLQTVYEERARHKVGFRFGCVLGDFADFCGGVNSQRLTIND